MKRKAKSEISDSAAKALKLQTRFVIIKMPVRQVIHSYLSSFLYPASTGSCFMKARQRKEKNKKYSCRRFRYTFVSINEGNKQAAFADF